MARCCRVLFVLAPLVLASTVTVDAQNVTASRPFVDIGPVGSECRVETCVEAEAERTGICAVQVLDDSGSMDANGRFAAALTGIEQFIDSLSANRGDRIGVVSFSGPERRFGATPQENPGPAVIQVIGEPPSLEYSIVKLLLGGVSTTSVSFLTPLSSAIETGANVLQACPGEALRVMIVSTDGLPNWHDDVQCSVTPLAATSCTDAALAAATDAKDSGIHVVTIGIDLDPSDASDAFGISLLREMATSPEDANFFNTADGLGQSDIFTHLAQRVASPSDVTFFEPLPDSCWSYVPGSTTGTITDEPVPGLIGSTQTLAWDLGVVSDGQTAGLCYAMAFDETCGETPSSLVVQSGGEAVWQLTNGKRVSASFGAQVLQGIRECTIVIPVELTDFRATSGGSNVTLVWHTASEVDNAGFAIERAPKREGFVDIDFIAGHGTSDTPNTYRFVDRNVAPGSYRYRLRQIDLDGSFTYSPVVETNVELPASHFMGAIYPNPMQRRGVVDLSVARSQLVQVDLLDTSGRLVQRLASRPMSGGVTETFTLDLPGVAAGVYVIRVRGEFFSTSRLALVAP